MILLLCASRWERGTERPGLSRSLYPASLHRGTLRPKGASFFSCCSNRQSPELWGFHCSRVLGKLGRLCLGKQLTPKCSSFRHILIPQNILLPNYFMARIPAKKTLESSFPPVPSPCRERLAPGPGGFRTVPTLYLPLIPSRAPFLSHPLSPSGSSSSNTNCLHGKSPSMTRFSTHKRKLWATDPTS